MSPTLNLLLKKKRRGGGGRGDGPQTREVFKISEWGRRGSWRWRWRMRVHIIYFSWNFPFFVWDGHHPCPHFHGISPLLYWSCFRPCPFHVSSLPLLWCFLPLFFPCLIGFLLFNKRIGGYVLVHSKALSTLIDITILLNVTKFLASGSSAMSIGGYLIGMMGDGFLVSGSGFPNPVHVYNCIVFLKKVSMPLPTKYTKYIVFGIPVSWLEKDCNQTGPRLQKTGQ